MMARCLNLFGVVLLAALSCAPLFAQQYAVSGTIALSGSGAWDYLAADSDGRRLYVSHTGEVNVVDLDSGKPVGTISGFGYVHGILVVRPTLGFISDGLKNEVAVFDPKTLRIKQKIAIEAEANSLAYDAGTDRLFIGERPLKSLAVLSAATMKVEGSIALDGTPRYQAADGKGSIYVILDDRSEMLRIDAKTMQVEKQMADGAVSRAGGAGVCGGDAQAVCAVRQPDDGGGGRGFREGGGDAGDRRQAGCDGIRRGAQACILIERGRDVDDCGRSRRRPV
jgi:hypothetical protein